MNNQSPEEEWDELGECLDTPPSKAGLEAERRQVREKSDAELEVAKELDDFDSPTMSESEVEVRENPCLEVRENAVTLMKRVDERRKGLPITQMTELSKEPRASRLVPTSSAKDARRDARRAHMRRQLQSAKGKADKKTDEVMKVWIERSKNEIIASNKEENEETRSVLGSKMDHIVQLLSAQKQPRPDVVAFKRMSTVSIESYDTPCTEGKRKRGTEPRNKNAYNMHVDSQKKGRIQREKRNTPWL